MPVETDQPAAGGEHVAADKIEHAVEPAVVPAERLLDEIRISVIDNLGFAKTAFLQEIGFADGVARGRDQPLDAHESCQLDGEAPDAAGTAGDEQRLRSG